MGFYPLFVKKGEYFAHRTKQKSNNKEIKGQKTGNKKIR